MNLFNILNCESFILKYIRKLDFYCRSIFVIVFSFLSSDILICQYHSPVKHKVLLGGAFGEIRGTHFHAGIDIKPVRPGYEGDHILSIADGYVSRIKIQRGGYGRAIYVDHPTGQRSVYGHLSSLSGEIQKIITSEQKLKESYEVDLYLTPDQLPVKKGQVLGKMGNAGRSFGSHLHFEIRDSKSDVTLHPSDWGFKHHDTQSPTIVSVGIHGLLPDFHHRSYVNIRNFSTKDNGEMPLIKIPAWTGGISLQAYDTHNGAINKNGYYEVRLFVDDTLYYHIKMDMITYDEGPLIKSFIDYPLRQTQNRTEALLYRLPSNQTLPVKYTYKNGVFPLFASKESKVKIEVSDYDGNKSFAYFRVKRAETIPDNILQRNYNHYLKVDSTYNQLTTGQIKFNISPFTFARNQYFNTQVYETYPICVQIGDNNEAVLKPFETCIPVNKELISKRTVLINKEGNTTFASIGDYNDGYWCVKIHALDKYCLSEDTLAPQINVITNLNKLNGTKNIIATISDNMYYRFPGTAFTYKVYIDGEFIPCEYRELNKRLTIPISSLHSGKHTLEIKCKDYVGNESVWKKEFVK